MNNSSEKKNFRQRVWNKKSQRFSRQLRGNHAANAWHCLDSRCHMDTLWCSENSTFSPLPLKQRRLVNVDAQRPNSGRQELIIKHKKTHHTHAYELRPINQSSSDEVKKYLHKQPITKLPFTVRQCT